MTPEWMIVTIVAILCITVVTVVSMYINHEQKLNQKG